jgi:hypothetical protein
MNSSRYDNRTRHTFVDNSAESQYDNHEQVVVTKKRWHVFSSLQSFDMCNELINKTRQSNRMASKAKYSFMFVYVCRQMKIIE